MCPVMMPPAVLITSEQSASFVHAISGTLSTLSQEDLKQVYLFHDKAVVISFSSNYEPFIGFTMSYNDPDHRVYIYQNHPIFRHIADAIDRQGRDIPGGRVFLRSQYVYIKDSEFSHKAILCFDWQGDDLYQKVKETYEELSR